ncbi:cell division protein ZapA [uncultured Brachyspira sp.]|uniref:cell division protein ZapA n=1 Tax=uncultured Brachyspira sp. TaxID=221953 RepID=UPI0025DEB7D7|nr:cell division protein ZapA [uncultured Brachyspira sp.]
MDNILEVNVYGRVLNIKSQDGNTQYLKEIADFVNESMNDIAEHYGTGYPRDTIAILACLNIADLLKREIESNKAGKDTLSAFKESIALRSNELIKLIDKTKAQNK